MSLVYEKVIGTRQINYRSKKTGEPSSACIVSLASKNETPDSWGASCRECFIDIKSKAYSTACKLRDGDFVIPIEQNGFVQDFLIQEKKEK